MDITTPIAVKKSGLLKRPIRSTHEMGVGTVGFTARRFKKTPAGNCSHKGKLTPTEGGFRREGGGHGLGPLPGLLAKNRPRHVRAKFFAGDNLIARPRLTLDDGAVLGGNTISEPGLHGLVPVVLDVQDARGLNRTTEDRYRPLGCGCSGGLVFHAPHDTQVFLSLPENLSFSGKTPHEKLASMSIHAKIKELRELRGLSHEKFAEAVAKLDGKPLTRSAVQQWEKEGGTAPKRTRLPVVAKVLGTTPQELLGTNGGAPQDFATLRPLEVSLVTAFRHLDAPTRNTLLSLVNDPVRLAELLALLGDTGDAWEFVTFAREFQKLSKETRESWKRWIKQASGKTPHEDKGTMFGSGLLRPRRPRKGGTEGTEGTEGDEQ